MQIDERAQEPQQVAVNVTPVGFENEETVEQAQAPETEDNDEGTLSMQARPSIDTEGAEDAPEIAHQESNSVVTKSNGDAG
ncbi:hypothetical protein AJ80_09622 [Polytolypa hystricis UAMH7299]|uniref:Uncharacterized protein n=1 Tax=Polytolypa hystricis (strain UAMH7299) TaxID=1447883 RepID=A0A2B7WN37_POLH7|nr:hypothetical protein AJ80_09622 [Polytolypa hystricis UAMH7299]